MPNGLELFSFLNKPPDLNPTIWLEEEIAEMSVGIKKNMVAKAAN